MWPRARQRVVRLHSELASGSEISENSMTHWCERNRGCCSSRSSVLIYVSGIVIYRLVSFTAGAKASNASLGGQRDDGSLLTAGLVLWLALLLLRYSSKSTRLDIREALSI